MPTPDRDLDAEVAEKITPELKAFLHDLTALSMRTGFWVNGCGECGSPWIQRDGVEGTIVENLFPTDECDGYAVSLENPWEKVIVRATRLAAESDA